MRPAPSPSLASAAPAAAVGGLVAAAEQEVTAADVATSPAALLDPAAAAGSASASSSSSASAAAAVSLPPPPEVWHAQSLYRDGVHSILAFLPLSDMARASRSCRSWRAHAHSLHARHTTSHTVPPLCDAAAHLAGLLASPLHVHVSSLVCTTPLSLAHLQLLRQFPALTRLHAQFDSTVAEYHKPDALVQQLFPSSLVELHVSFPPASEEGTASFVHPAIRKRLLQRLLHAAHACRALTTLTLDDRTLFTSGALDFKPLIELPALTSLAINFLHVNQEHMRAIKQIAGLRHLDLGRCRLGSLQALCTPPHAMQKLETVEVVVNAQGLGGVEMDALAHLPALTRLPREGAPMRLEALGRLHALHQLRSLKFCRRREADEAKLAEPPRRFPSDQPAVTDASTLAEHLLPCSFLPLLHILELNFIESMTDALADALFGRLTQVRVLILESVALSSLRFLRHVPLLEQLSLTDCGAQLQPSDLPHILALTRLAHLHLHQPAGALLRMSDAQAVARLLPPLRCCFHACFKEQCDSPRLSVVHSPHRFSCMGGGAAELSSCCLPRPPSSYPHFSTQL